MDQFSANPVHLATSPVLPAEAEAAMLRRVFQWMATGLVVTAGVAFYVTSNPDLLMSLVRGNMFMILLLVELGFVFALSAGIKKMSPAVATSCFVIYSALNGVTLAPLTMVYTGESITKVFMIAAGMFGAMAFFGATTKRDLSAIGSFAMMGLFGLVIASIVNIFMQSSGLSWALSIVGVVVFTLLTAYDIQKVKDMSREVGRDQSAIHKVAIMGALMLYLDLINLFLSLLRLLGDRR